jgi:hypothetical protein
VGAAATIKVSVLLSQKRRAHFSIFAPHPSIPQSAAMSLAARSARTHIIINSTLFFTYNSLLLYAKQLLADTRQSNMYTSESRGAELFQAALAAAAPLLLLLLSPLRAAAAAEILFYWRAQMAGIFNISLFLRFI